MCGLFFVSRLNFLGFHTYFLMNACSLRDRKRNQIFYVPSGKLNSDFICIFAETVCRDKFYTKFKIGRVCSYFVIFNISSCFALSRVSINSNMYSLCMKFNNKFVHFEINLDVNHANYVYTAANRDVTFFHHFLWSGSDHTFEINDTPKGGLCSIISVSFHSPSWYECAKFSLVSFPMVTFSFGLSKIPNNVK